MPTKYRYIAEESVNLGRFGHVKKGDTLTLTAHEETHIDSDERFEKVDPNEKPKAKTPEKPKLNLPENFESLSTAEKKKATIKAEKEAAESEETEKARVQKLEEANRKAKIEEINQMKLEELREYVKTLRAAGTVVDVKDDSDAKQTKIAIKAALFGDNRTEE